MLAIFCIAMQLADPVRTVDGRVVDAAGLPIGGAVVTVVSAGERAR